MLEFEEESMGHNNKPKHLADTINFWDVFPRWFQVRKGSFK
jgi:hypothetical protein